MAPMARRGMVVGLAVVAVLFAVPGAAFAHGIGGGAESVMDFVWSGFTHMITGWDHLLFIAGVVLLAGQAKRAAKLISLFAAGHSTTLIIATLAEWRISAVAVDVVIALSVVFVGVVGWFGRPTKWGWFAAAVTGFGLVHGLGLSTRLQALGLPEDGLLARVIAFNVGVEIGQLIAVLAMFMIGDVLRHYLGRAKDGRVVGWLRSGRAAHAGLVVAGLAAAGLLVVVGGGEDDQPAQAAPVGSCQVRERTEKYQGIGGHPSKDFFEPTETAPQDDFGHVLGDGYVIVHYPPTLPADQLAELRAHVTGPNGNKVVAGTITGQTEPLKAVNVYNTLVCGTLDLTALTEFQKTWFADPRSKTPE
jgi:hydrogenase/urease accessory protein HupE